MSKIIKPLSLFTITDVDPSGIPKRRLQLGIRFRNPLHSRITTLDACSSASTLMGNSRANNV